MRRPFAQYAEEFLEGCQPGTIFEAEFDDASDMDDAAQALRNFGCDVRCDDALRRLYVTAPANGHVPAASNVETVDLTRATLIAVLVVAHGEVSALRSVLAQLPVDFPAALLILTRAGTGRERSVDRHLSVGSGVLVSPGEDGVLLRKGHAYVVPSDGGFVVDGDGRLAHSAAGRRRAFDPVSDGLLDSLSHLAGGVIAVALVQLDADEAEGFRRIREGGGHTIALDEAAQPWAASSPVHEILPIHDLRARMLTLMGVQPI